MKCTPEKMFLPTIDSTIVEVFCNWNDKVKGEYLKISVDGKNFITPRSAFLKVAMIVANKEEQVDLVPTKSIPVRVFEKRVTVKLKKNMRMGELLTIPVSFSVPLNKNGDLAVL